MVPGLGVRCVRDEPWVTGAETCELVMALDATGDRDRALAVFGEVQHLRDTDGGYWTGWQYANQAHFPDERSSWTAAAMILVEEMGHDRPEELWPLLTEAILEHTGAALPEPAGE